jgi:hypothetical protein
MRAHIVEATAQVRTMSAGTDVSAHAAQQPNLQDNTQVEQQVYLSHMLSGFRRKWGRHDAGRVC